MATAVSGLTARERMVRSRIKLLLSFPFFGALALNLQLVEVEDDKACPTAAVDGKHLFYNPKFVAKLSTPELNFIVLHEVLHPALGHLWRKGNRNHVKWNFATDYCINTMINELDRAIFKMPTGILYDPKYDGMAAEEVYELLPDPEKLQGQSGAHGGKGNSGGQDPNGSHDSWSNSGGKDGEEEWKNQVAAAAGLGMGRGSMPAGLKRYLKYLQHPRKNWLEVLSEFISYEVNDYSFNPPDRRYAHMDLILPDFSEQVETIKSLVVAIDTSGSVDDGKLSVFMSEIIGLINQFAGVTGVLMYFDAHVAAVYDLEEPGTWEPKGGGGTDFRPIFNYIRDQELDCAGCIIVTDLDGYMPAEKDYPTDYPVLWVCDNKRHEEVPFGQLTYID